MKPIRSVWVDRPLADLTPEDRDDWVRWLAQHDLDPDRIPVESWIEADDQSRMVTATYIQVDDKGRARCLDCHGGHFMVETATRRLEARPAPFPPGYGEGS
jgi:hypothetical protein